MQSKIVKYDAVAFEAYAILASEQFIGIADIVEDIVLAQKFDSLHVDTIDNTLMKLNAECILSGDSSEIVRLFNELDEI